MPKPATYQVMMHPQSRTYRVFTDGTPLALEIAPDAPSWQTWLEDTTSFSFQSQSGERCTIRKENVQRGGAYWYAYRRKQGRTVKRYLGRSADLTAERLERAAAELASPAISPSPDPLASSRQAVGARLHHPRARGQALRAEPSGLAASHLLLTTKMRLPRTPARMVSRPHVLQRLRRGEERPLTIVAAPAGFGKTTALCDWARQTNLPVGWVSLDASDNDPVQFWMYVLTALDSAAPHLADTALAMLTAPQPLPLDAILRATLNGLAALDHDIALVLDDYHLVTTPAIHDALAFLLEHPPAQLHLYLALRGEPPLPLGRLRIYDLVNQINADHLRFRPDEAAAFLDDVMGISLDVEEVMQLAERTDGWIAGIQLAGLSLQERPDFSRFIAGFSGSHRDVVLYLGEEVLAAQPEEVQTFLLRTAVLERMCAPLCDAVTGRGDGRAMLERLERGHLFLFALDDERRWYRYYHLFADLLRQRLRERASEDIPELHRRAALWLEREDLLSEAAEHLLAIPDVLAAAAMIERSAEKLLRNGEVTPLLSLIAHLPEDVIAEHPYLCLYQAQGFLARGQLEAAELCLARAEASAPYVAVNRSMEPDDVHKRALASGIAVGRAVLSAMHGDAATTLMFAQRALDIIADDERIERSGAILTLGHARRLMGDMRGAAAAYEEAVRLSQEAGNLFLATTALLQWAFVSVWRGQIHQAADLYRQVIQMAEAQGGAAGALAGGAYTGLADRLYEWNDLSEAERAVQRTIALGEQWANDEDQVDGLARLALVYLAQGRTDEARASIQRAEGRIQSGAHYPWLPMYTAALAARLALRTGRISDAQRWARSNALELASPGRPAIFEEYNHLTLARVFIASGRPDDALRLLDSLRRSAEAEERVNAIIEIEVLAALAHQAQDESEAALKALSHAVALAEPEGYVRVFVDEGTSMRNLLARLRARLPPDDVRNRYAGTLLAAFESTTSRASTHGAGLAEPLSEREREVLRLLAEGHSNQEIARALVVAVSTVKTHVHHIYAKLQAADRLQAVTRARALGLLTE